MGRILLADADPKSLDFLRTLLVNEGYAVETARDDIEALTAAQRGPPDIFISTLLEPKMGSNRLLSRWRVDPCLTSVPVIVYARALSDSDYAEFAADAFVLSESNCFKRLSF